MPYIVVGERRKMIENPKEREVAEGSWDCDFINLNPVFYQQLGYTLLLALLQFYHNRKIIWTSVSENQVVSTCPETLDMPCWSSV